MKRNSLHIVLIRAGILKKIFSVWVCLFIAIFSSGQSKTASEYQVKAVFLYNFTQFVDWPSSSFSGPEDPFVIGIVGDDPFSSYLDETIAGEKVGTHPLVIKRFSDARDISRCHMLYVNSEDPEWVRRVLTSVSHRNILTVSDLPDFNRLGGIIRFFTEDKRIRLQINLEKSKDAQLNISSKLLSVAKIN